jgi:DNA-binding SARP family transcriptional activator
VRKEAEHVDFEKAMLNRNYPYLRVSLIGDFRVTWQVPSAGEKDAWQSRTSARSLFKLLLCAPNRQATRSQLVGILWPDVDEHNARESLRSAIKVLRRVLQTASGEALLEASQGEVLKLQGQERIWVDADALETLVQQASTTRNLQEAQSLLVQAKEIVQGEFLADEQTSEWTNCRWVKVRRQELRAARRRMIRSLADLYIQNKQNTLAEELLHEHVVRFPTDQDALYRLMKLLIQVECFDEALLYFEQCKAALTILGKRPADHLLTLAEHLRGKNAAPYWQAEKIQGNRVDTDLIETITPLRAFSLFSPNLDIHIHSAPPTILGELSGFRGQESNILPERFSASLPLSSLFRTSINGPSSPSALLNIPSEQLLALENLSSIGKETLHLFAALTEICRHLSEGNELLIAEHILWTYLPKIELLARVVPEYQRQAANIASQGYLLAASLAGHRNKLLERLHYSEQALLYGELASDLNLQVVAMRQIAISFDCMKRPDKVLEVSQRTFPYLNNVSPLLSACIYAGVSGAYAQLKQKQEALNFIHRAYEHFPEKPENEPGYLHTVCRYSTLVFFDGLNYLDLDQPLEAEKILARIDGLNPKIQLPERVRIELLNYQVEVFTTLKSMEQACAYLEAAAQAAVKIGSKRHFQDSFTLFRQMQKTWRNESRVQDLADLFIR